MALPMPTVADLLPLGPEIFVCGAAFALLMVDLFLSDQRRGLTHFLALFILAGAAVLTVRDLAMEPVYGFANMFVRDTASDVLKLAVYLVAGASFVYAKPYLQDRGLFKGEFYVLGLFAVLGMMLMISAGSMLTVYLGLELLALSSYGLVGMDRDNPRSSEAAMKYIVLGSMASGLLLYGMSMVYGATGSLMLGEIHAAAASSGDRTLLLFGVVFMLVGIAFKFGAAPFHMWLPDVYHGAPTAITLFIGSAPKLAAFGMAYRLLEAGVGPLDPYWQDMVAWVAALSLVIGNLVALVQTNLKRMLAYSTVSHVGFLFMGLAHGGNLGYSAAMFYAISYAIMSAAAFGAIIALSRKGFESENIDDFKGLWSRNPGQAVLVLFVMASLAGVPPFLGFWAKLEVLVAALDAGLMWLAVVGVVFAVIGAFYYLRVIKVMFFDEPEGEGARVHPDSHLRVLFAVNAAALLVLGLFADTILAWCGLAFPA
ncbi:NADH-quinone oxidoreductase subunit NuoN [Arenimonas terrae]|jgi:NADH-quinone oxidoreductase subunit N|uniref:NADH-quinone oxidoreductase subunit N n=1 Tax=Arenimonas terrae TaxID=2546226 RepID=A0A5C4RTU3_9GAMM|nr:NADH-quinone oxidoreductase subunit NuoN [Arenimonas terrae]TNJ34394.1 NADH-quinone oxidoreductase subunit NuoN [Arenimonas terrae]